MSMMKPSTASRVARTVSQRLYESSAARVATRSRLTMMPSQQFQDQDWKQARDALLRTMQEDEEMRNEMAYSLQFGTQDEDSIFPSLDIGLTEEMKSQIKISSSQLIKKNQTGQIPLPRTLDDAVHEQYSHRALVVTEVKRPFEIVNVNNAWEGLCGYTYVESKGKSLGDLLQGEETDQSVITAMLSTLMRGEEAGAVLVNYKKDGQKFHNRLRIGPMHDESGNVSHFVGELKEVQM